MRRRQFVKLIASAGIGATPACRHSSAPIRPIAKRRVLVVAFDGLDPRIVQSLMRNSRLPAYSRLAAMGSFARLRTSTPPHTPVAFSSIISGADPGVHQIFDFIHRDPNPTGSSLPIRPYFSTADTVVPESQWTVPLGRWQLPLSGTQTRMLRRGPAFWDQLIRHGIDAQIYYLPSNYPPSMPEGPGRFRCISGMGTPDLLGSYGEFSMFTPDAPAAGRRVGGGIFSRLEMSGHRGRGLLIGPANFLRSAASANDAEPLTVPIEIVRDPTAPVAKVKLCRTLVLLVEGEWSDWIPIDFQTGIPGSAVLRVAGAPTSVRGMVRMFLKQVHPAIELYVSPINIDPLMPANPVSAPPEFSQELAQTHGRFYTAGIPEDTKALSHGALTEDQFLAQSELAMQERITQYRHALANFEQGCLFFYFGATDLLQHMFWRDRDPQHPGRRPDQADRYAQVIQDTYSATDSLIQEALDILRPDDTLIVLSDHGFTTFRRGFNLNSWLLDNGYVQLVDPLAQGKYEMFMDVNWAATKAYGLGLNGLYLNMIGREQHGAVPERRRRSLLGELRDRLLGTRDVDGQPIIQNVELVEDIYPTADPAIAPDLIVGYSDGYRASWATVLGRMPRPLVEDNLDRWSGDHSIAADLVPGILLSSRPLDVADPTISDIAPTILKLYGIPVPAEMTGRALLDGHTA